jgi:hypothetical protein
MQTLTDTERCILDLASEDCTPLFDVLAVIRDHRPHDDTETHLRLSKEMVGRLLKLGYVELLHDNPDGTRRTFRPLSHEEARAAFADQSVWCPDSWPAHDAERIGISITSEGEAALAR